MEDKLAKIIQEYKDRNTLEEGDVYSVEEVEEGAIDFYKEAMKQHEIASLSFYEATSDGDLINRDEYGISIVMRNEDVKGTRYNPWYRLNYIDVPFDVAVKSIDEDNNIVYVSAALAQQYMGKTESRILDREIQIALSNLKEGQHLILPGRVITVKGHGGEEVAIINLLSKGVLGVISIKDWSTAFVRELRTVCRPGSSYDFEVVCRTEYTVYKRGNQRKKLHWQCSRVNICKDPWTEKNLGMFKKGDLLKIKCVQIPFDGGGKPKTYWWGICERVHGIEIFCNYSNNVNVVVGQTYTCTIVDVDYKSKMFKVTPLKNSPNIVHTTPLFRPAKRSVNKSDLQ